MGDKFLGSGGSNINISNGTASIFGASIGAINLDPSQPLKTNSVRQLVSSKLDIDDINNLQNELNNAITDPITLKEKAQPANPAVNTKIIYASSADNEIHLLDEFGVDKIFSTSTTPFLPLGGGTMTGNLDMGNQQILNASIAGGLGLEAQNNKDNIIILQSDLGTETTNRTNADTNLQTQITSNDTDILNLQTDLATEATLRTNADALLQIDINEIKDNPSNIEEIKTPQLVNWSNTNKTSNININGDGSIQKGGDSLTAAIYSTDIIDTKSYDYTFRITLATDFGASHYIGLYENIVNPLPLNCYLGFTSGDVLGDGVEFFYHGSNTLDIRYRTSKTSSNTGISDTSGAGDLEVAGDYLEFSITNSVITGINKNGTPLIFSGANFTLNEKEYYIGYHDKDTTSGSTLISVDIISKTLRSGIISEDSLNYKIYEIGILQNDLITETTNRTNEDTNLQNQITSNDTDILNLQNNLATETTNRTNADTALQNQITTNDTDILNLQTDLGTETTNRTNADTNLQNQINSNDTQILNLQNGYTILQNQITSNDTDILNLQTDLGTETTNRTNADTNLQTQITSNDTDILNLQTDLGTETTNRTNADTNLQNQINSNDTQILNLQNGYTILQNQITSNDTDILNLQNNLATETTNRTNADTALQTEVAEIQENPTGLTDNLLGYYPEWFYTSPSNILTSSNGILEKINASTDVDFAFTKPSINPQQFNYIVTFSVLGSNSGAQLYAGFGTLGTTPFHRAGTDYPTTSGTTGSWPIPSTVNGYGSSWLTRITPSFGAVDKNFPVSGTTYVPSSDEVDVTSASELNPYSLTVHIVDGYVTKMLVSYTAGGIVTEIDYMVTQNWTPWELPKGNLYIQYIDTNNFSTGNSDWTVQTNIMQRTKRTDTYTLATGLQGNPSLYPEVVTQTGVEGRFIPVGCKVAKLQGHPGTTNSIKADVYFLPPATHKGERIVLINESGRNLTIYQPQPPNPTASTSTWETFTFNHSATQDHTEFIALSTFEWHRL